MAQKKKKTSSKSNTSKKSSGKKSSSSKKSSAKKQNAIKIRESEIMRWVVGFLAFFIIFTFFPFNSGWFGEAVSNVLKGLFGPMYYVVPFILIAIVVTWSRDRENDVVGMKNLIYLLEFVFISVVVHIAVAGDDVVNFHELYESGIQLRSAGLISGGIGAGFVFLFSNIPSMILAIMGIFVCTVLLCGTTPKDTVMAIVNFFRDAFERMSRDDDDEYYEYDEEEEIEQAPVVLSPQRRERRIKRAALPEDPGLRDEPVQNQYSAEPMAEPAPLPEPEYVPEPEPQPVVNSAFPEEFFREESTEASVPATEAPAAEAAEPAIQEAKPEISDALLEEEDEELFLDPIEDTPYVFPPISLLTADSGNSARPLGTDIDRTSRKLEEVLASFNVKAKVIDTTYGPTVTRYELQPETGVRVKSIVNLADDIALHLAATAIRIENIPGKAAVGIEIPNKNTSTVRLRGLIDNPVFRDNKSRLYCALGEDVAGKPVYLDIAKMPHLLVAGATGQGKSVCINSLILSLLYRNHPNDVKLILIDPKTVEFSDFKDIPHLLVPVINDPKNAAGTLNWACSEMENRYKLIQEVGARDLAGYNMAVSDDPERPMMPQIVIFIDEFADLMMTAPDDVETSVCRLAQKARAAGMHLVIGTQRPSVDVITGLIKANIPSRIALTTTSAVDSRTIIDQVGAEKLLGRGDMLYYPVGAMKPVRVQGAFVDGKTEVQAVTQFIKEAAHAQYDEAIMKQIEQEAKLCGMKGKKGAAEAEPDDGNEKLDPMFMDAVEVAIECGTVSTSLLQRRLSLGYARAARIIDKMERRGYIGEFDAATKKRGVLITREQFAELKLNGETKKEEENV